MTRLRAWRFVEVSPQSDTKVLGRRRTTEYPANGSFAKPPPTQRVLHARHDPRTMPYNGDVVADGFETVEKENMVKPHG
jgi:hypothetical protein